MAFAVPNSIAEKHPILIGETRENHKDRDCFSRYFVTINRPKNLLTLGNNFASFQQ